MAETPFHEQYRQRSAVTSCSIFTGTQAKASESDPEDWVRDTNFSMPDGSIELEERSKPALEDYWHKNLFSKITEDETELANLKAFFEAYFTQAGLFGVLTGMLSEEAVAKDVAASCKTSYRFVIENGHIIFEEHVEIMALAYLDGKPFCVMNDDVKVQEQHLPITEATCRWAISKKAKCTVTDVVIKHHHRKARRVFDTRPQDLIRKLIDLFKRLIGRNKLKKLKDLRPSKESRKYRLPRNSP